jgi:hypothetical protein
MEYKVLDQDPMKLNQRDYHLIRNKIDQISLDIVHLNRNQVQQLIHPTNF